MEGEFYVYIIENTEKKHYIGITSNLDKRLFEHNEGKSTYTKQRRPWILFWKSKKLNHTDALKLEKLMKRQKGGNGLKVLIDKYKGS